MTSPDAPRPDRYPAGSAAFLHRDLTGLAGLAPWELLFLLDEAEQWVTLGRSAHKRDERLAEGCSSCHRNSRLRDTQPDRANFLHKRQIAQW